MLKLTRLKIVTICGVGVGTSILLKMNIEKILEQHNLEPDKDFNVICCGFHEACSMEDTDLFVSQKEFADQVNEYAKENKKNWKIIEIKDYLNTKELSDKLNPVLKELKIKF